MVIDGGRTYTGIDALAWSKRGEELGAGEICLNSIDADGTKEGYELKLTNLIINRRNGRRRTDCIHDALWHSHYFRNQVLSSQQGN